MSRHDFNDAEYEQILDLLPAERPGKRGRPYVSHRQVLNGIGWILTTATPWRDLLEEFGKWKTVYDRFRRWTQQGLWQKLCERLLWRIDEEGKLDRTLWCVDGTTVRAHRCCSGAPAADSVTQPEEPEDHALGRSRGGYSSKLHLVTDGEGVPLAVTLTAGQRHECTQFETLLEAVPLVSFTESPLHEWPDAVAGDKGYASGSIRAWLEQHSMEDVIPTKNNQLPNEMFDKQKYKARNIIERVIGWLKEKRRIFTRFEKKAIHYLAMVRIAIARRLMNL